MAESKTYIDAGYDELLQREDALALSLGEGVVNNFTTQGAPSDSIYASGAGGSVERVPVKDGASLSDIWITNAIRSESWKPKSVGFYLDGLKGYAEFADVWISGTITATSGLIGGWSINATSIYTGTEDHAGYTANAGDITLYSDGADASLHAFNWYIDSAGVFNTRSGVMSGVSIASVPNDTATDLSLLALTHNIIFSSSDLDTVAWAAGTITFSNGRTFSIDAGNTGNMAARTYIYLDTAVSSTVLQVTTSPTTAHGANKVTLAVAVNSTDKAEFLTYHGTGTRNILVDNVAANSASVNEFVSNTAQIKDLVVTNAKINDLAVDKLTAGTITSKIIVLSFTDTVGDVAIRCGKTDFGDNTTSGFILGIDDSDSNKVKFEIGSSATKIMTYNGTDLSLIGGTITSGTVRTSSASPRIELSGTNNRLDVYNSAGTNIAYFGSSGANGNVIFINQSDTNEDFPPVHITSAQDSNVINAINTNSSISNRPAFRFEGNNTNSELAYFLQTGAYYGVSFESTNTAASGESTIYIVQNSTGYLITTNVAGCFLTKAGVWTDASSETLKENFEPLTVLGRLKQLQIKKYNYIAERQRNEAEIRDDCIRRKKRQKYSMTDEGRKCGPRDQGYVYQTLTTEEMCDIEQEVSIELTREGTRTTPKHFTPMAEDFNRLFGVGDTMGLSPSDVAGVALQAIKELHAEVELLKNKK